MSSSTHFKAQFLLFVSESYGPVLFQVKYHSFLKENRISFKRATFCPIKGKISDEKILVPKSFLVWKFQDPYEQCVYNRKIK